MRLTAYDKAGNSAQTSLLVKLAGILIPTKEAQTQAGLPTAFVLPNPFDRSVSAETTFVYYLRGNFNSSIYLFDLSGSLIWQKNFAAGDNGGKAGLNNTAWNGANFFGENVPNGVYLFQVTADGKIVARGKIIVIN